MDIEEYKKLILMCDEFLSKTTHTHNLYLHRHSKLHLLYREKRVEIARGFVIFFSRDSTLYMKIIITVRVTPQTSRSSRLVKISASSTARDDLDLQIHRTVKSKSLAQQSLFIYILNS